MLEAFTPLEVGVSVAKQFEVGSEYTLSGPTSVLGRGATATVYKVSGLFETAGWRSNWDEKATIVYCTSCCVMEFGNGHASADDADWTSVAGS